MEWPTFPSVNVEERQEPVLLLAYTFVNEKEMKERAARNISCFRQNKLNVGHLTYFKFKFERKQVKCRSFDPL